MVIILLNINICLSIWCHICVSQHCSFFVRFLPFPPLSLSLFPLYFLSISSQLGCRCPWLRACDIVCECTGSVVPFHATLQAPLPFNMGYWACLCCQQGHWNTHGCMFYKGTLSDKGLTIDAFCFSYYIFTAEVSTLQQINTVQIAQYCHWHENENLDVK